MRRGNVEKDHFKKDARKPCTMSNGLSVHCTGLYWTVLDCTGLYWTVLYCTAKHFKPVLHAKLKAK
jgi:hypothetical protein